MPQRPPSVGAASISGDNARSVSNAASAIEASMRLSATPAQVGTRVDSGQPRGGGDAVGARVSKLEAASSRVDVDTRCAQASRPKPVHWNRRQPDNIEVSVLINRTTPELPSTERVEHHGGLVGDGISASTSVEGAQPLLTSATKTRARPMRGSRRRPGRRNTSSESTSGDAGGGTTRNDDRGSLTDSSGDTNQPRSNTVAPTISSNVKSGSPDGGAASAMLQRRFQDKIGMKTVANACTVCSKTVYHTERVLGTDKPCHRGCFRCAADGCGSTLNAKSYVSNDGKLLCPKHGEEAIASSPTGSRGHSPEITCTLFEEVRPQELFLLGGACVDCRSACVVCCANRVRAGEPRAYITQ